MTENDDFDYATYISGFSAALYELSRRFEYEYFKEFKDNNAEAEKVKNLLVDILDEQRVVAIQKLGETYAQTRPLYL